MRFVHTSMPYKEPVWPCTRCGQPGSGTVLAEGCYFELPCGCAWIRDTPNLTPEELAVALLLSEET